MCFLSSHLRQYHFICWLCCGEIKMNCNVSLNNFSCSMARHLRELKSTFFTLSIIVGVADVWYISHKIFFTKLAKRYYRDLALSNPDVRKNVEVKFNFFHFTSSAVGNTHRIRQLVRLLNNNTRCCCNNGKSIYSARVSA
jgi:hypothetical protein